MPKKSSGKKKVTARRQETEAPRQPARHQEMEVPRQPAPRQEMEAPRQPTCLQDPFQLVLPSELADLASTRNIQVAQVRQPPTTQSQLNKVRMTV